MNTPERSAAIARALASEADDLPEDFAVRVAALAEADERRSRAWNDLALLGAFVAMLGVCVAGWLTFAPQQRLNTEWLEPIAQVVASQPWLFIGVAGFVTVHLLSFRRRAMT
jgi:hypothetical protein